MGILDRTDETKREFIDKALNEEIERKVAMFRDQLTSNVEHKIPTREDYVLNEAALATQDVRRYAEIACIVVADLVDMEVDGKRFAVYSPAGQSIPDAVTLIDLHDRNQSGESILLDPENEENSWKEEMLDKVDLIDAPEVGSILYPNSRSSAATVKYNRDKGYILGFCKKGSNKFLYPAFQFDNDKGVIRPEVKKGNELLDAIYNPWAALSWWITPNSFIHDNLSPIELVEANDLDKSEVEELIQIQFGGQTDR